MLVLRYALNGCLAAVNLNGLIWRVFFMDCEIAVVERSNRGQSEGEVKGAFPEMTVEENAAASAEVNPLPTRNNSFDARYIPNRQLLIIVIPFVLLLI